MIDPKDLDICAEAIRHGSRSFHTASKVLPARVRDPAFALYAFCRLADDAVDLQADKTSAVLSLRDRLDLIYAGTPKDAAADRAFAAMVEEFEMPRALPEALLEGLAWDALEKRYKTFSDLVGYSARVASTVGVMMCVLMGVRERNALARAADLGVAMQLTNIARDVGEDALEGRLYLPLDWFEQAGLSPKAFLETPALTSEIQDMVRRLHKEAELLYDRSEAGIGKLPFDCRPGILAARFVYAGIAADLAVHNYDSINRRAHTNRNQKLGAMSKALLRAAAISLSPQSAVLYAKPLPEVAFLVDAAGKSPETTSSWGDGRTGAFLQVFAQLELNDRSRKAAFANPSKEVM